MNLRSQNKISPEFSMSSMTDIVFLLLIFFMLTSTMVSTNVLNLELPKAKGNAVKQQQLVISINNEGEYFVNGTKIKKENLEQILVKELSNSTDKGFVLQAENKAYTEDIVYVMDAANRNHYKMVLATSPNE